LFSKRQQNSLVILLYLFIFFIALDSTSIAILKTQTITNNNNNIFLLMLKDSVRDIFEKLQNKNKIVFNKINNCVVIYIFLIINNSRIQIKFFAF